MSNGSIFKRIHSALDRMARAGGQTKEQLVDHYVRERFLYRLSVSSLGDHIALKGGVLLQYWSDLGRRPTKDIDLHYSDLDKYLGDLKNQVQDAIANFVGVEDGVEFEPVTIDRNSRNFRNVVRMSIRAKLGKTRSCVKVDIGVKDHVYPIPQRKTIQALLPLLDLPQANIHCYPPEPVIAEKYEAMVQLGSINSRMKDFFDIWLISSLFEIDGRELQKSVETTFKQRGTAIQVPASFSDPNFIRDRSSSWDAYRSTVKCSLEFSEIISFVNDFLKPVVWAIHQEKLYKKMWLPEQNGFGGWSS